MPSADTNSSGFFGDGMVQFDALPSQFAGVVSGFDLIPLPDQNDFAM
jgi:hypothetical protein